MMIAERISLIFVLCSLFLLCLSCPQPAFADGGAPDLAYVAWAATGVGVIDIAHQRVSRTLAIDGDPHTILLSSDGRFLYTTQPTRGRVSVLDAASGKIQCSLPFLGDRACWPWLLSMKRSTSQATTMHMFVPLIQARVRSSRLSLLPASSLDSLWPSSPQSSPKVQVTRSWSLQLRRSAFLIAAESR